MSADPEEERGPGTCPSCGASIYPGRADRCIAPTLKGRRCTYPPRSVTEPSYPDRYDLRGEKAALVPHLMEYCALHGHRLLREAYRRIERAERGSTQEVPIPERAECDHAAELARYRQRSRDEDTARIRLNHERIKLRDAITEALYDYDHGDEVSAIDRLRAAVRD